MSAERVENKKETVNATAAAAAAAGGGGGGGDTTTTTTTAASAQQQQQQAEGNNKEKIKPLPEPKGARSAATINKICFMKLCNYSEWIHNTIDSRRRRWSGQYPHIQAPWKIISVEKEKEKQKEKEKKEKELFQNFCTLEAALLALGALDETTSSQYVIEELQYYLLTQTLLHNDPLSETITVAEAATLFISKKQKPVVSFNGFGRLFDENGIDDAGVERLEALLDAQKAMYNRIGFLEDKDESFAREQIDKEAVHEAGELLSALRRMTEVAELKAQLSRATSRKIEQAQVLASLGALHLESVKKDVHKATQDTKEAAKLASAVETAIAAARNTAEALSEESGVNSRAFEDEKRRVMHDCQEGCRDALNHAASRWSMLDMRMERLERLMVSVGRSALVCSMSHLPLAEHQKILPDNNNNTNKKEKNNNSQEDDDDSILDQSMEWLQLSTSEKFGLMSSCHVLKDQDPGEHVVTSAVAMTLSDLCVFSKANKDQIDSALLGATLCFLALCETETSNLFLASDRNALQNALSAISQNVILPGNTVDLFLDSLAIDLPGGSTLWRASTQTRGAASAAFKQQQQQFLTSPSRAGNKQQLIMVNQAMLDNEKKSRIPPMIGSTRFGNVNTPGFHSRTRPWTESTFRVGVHPMDYSAVAGGNSSVMSGSSNLNTSNRQQQQQQFFDPSSSNNIEGGGGGEVGGFGSPASTSASQVAAFSYSGRKNKSFNNNNNNSSYDHSGRGGGGGNGNAAEAVVNAAAATTLPEFVRCLSDVARIYLGAGSAGTSSDYCLDILSKWKLTPLAPLLPLLSTSMLLRQPPSAFEQARQESLQSKYNQWGTRNQLLQDPKFSQAWSRLVGSSHHHHHHNHNEDYDNNNNNNNFSPASAASGGLNNSPSSSSSSSSGGEPTIGDVASFLLAHFPDVIAAARGWDSSLRAGFSGSEIFVVRCVLYVSMAVGQWLTPQTLLPDAQGFDFVRQVGNYKNNNNNNKKKKNASSAAAAAAGGGEGQMQVEIRDISVEELSEFISTRPCPWRVVAQAWPEGQMDEHHNSSSDNQLHQQLTEEEGEMQDLQVGADDPFKEAVQEAGLPTEVLQAFPAWETIAAVVRRAEHSLSEKQ